MKKLSPARWFFPVLLLMGSPAAAQEIADPHYEEWVEYRDGEVSMAFDEIPVDLALDAIRVRTGLQIIVPTFSSEHLLTLQLDRAPLEPAVRSFIATIGFKNFALVYGDDGRPNRAVVLSAASEDNNRRRNTETESAPTKEPVPQPLMANEKETIQKELGRWRDLNREQRGRVEERLKTLPPSEDRESLMAEYGRQLLSLNRQDP